jgi:hypothetical protein
LRKVLVQKRTAFGIKSTKDQVESKTRVWVVRSLASGSQHGKLQAE